MRVPLKRNRRTDIVVVGHHPLIRERLRDVIGKEPDLRITGEAGNCREAFQILDKRKAQLLLLELRTQHGEGCDCIREIHTRWPNLHILALSRDHQSVAAERVFQSGARGYITEQETTKKLREAVRQILAGELYLSESLARQIVLKNLTKPPFAQLHSPSVGDLSEREQEVFAWVGQGYSTPEIAERLHLHPKTVETYRARIKEKLGLTDGRQLLQQAIRWNHLCVPSDSPRLQDS